MNLQDLQTWGAMAPEQPVRRSVEWVNADGEAVTFEVGVRRLSVGDYEGLAQQYEGEERRSWTARLIAAAIVLDDGVRFTYAQAYQLLPSFAAALVRVYNEVNPRPEKKASPGRSDSGASLPPSSDAASES
jgi:hypothetical protein